MRNKRPLGVDFIVVLNIVGAMVLIWTVFAVDITSEPIGISARIGLPFISEAASRIIFSSILLILAFELGKMSKRGLWLSIILSMYMVLVSLILYIKTQNNLFFVNLLTNLTFLVYINAQRQYFTY